MRILRLVLILIAALLFIPAAGLATETISGTFKIFRLGEPIGAERFTIRFQENGSYRAEGNISTTVDGTRAEMSTVIETQGANAEIQAYEKELTVNDLPSRFVLVRERGAFKVAIADGIRRSEELVRFDPTALLVEPNVAHHVIPLIRRFRFRLHGPQRFQVYLGSEQREAVAILTLTGNDPAVLSYGAFAARRMFLDLGDVGLQLWIGEGNQLLRLENPMQGFVMERLRYDGERIEPPVREAPRHAELTYEAVSVPADRATLSGMLTRPAGREGPLPAVVFISDDGPQDRDGTVPFTNINIGTAQMMDAISARGYVVLRYDDRGVAESSGNLLTTTLAVVKADALAAVEHLRARPDVDPSRIALIGQGAGGNVAIQIAGERSDLAAVIALAPSSVPLDQLALEQARRRLEEQGVGDPSALRHTIIHRVLHEATSTERQWLVLGQKAVFLDIFRQYAALRPAEDIVRVRRPLLLVQGKKDLQMFPAHGEANGAVCAAAEMENCTYREFAGLDHFFMPSRGTIGAYSDPSRRVDSRFIDYLAEWLEGHL